jgi:enoyl-CoA hydratase/carnithine racemase
MKLSHLAFGVAGVALALSPIWTLPAFAANAPAATTARVAQTATTPAIAAQPAYFTAYSGLTLTRDADGVLVVAINRNGAPLTFTARDHTQFTDAFYQIAQDRANKIVILTGNGTDFISGIDFASFGNVASSSVWSQVHDEGGQILENLANIRVPVIAAIEGKAHVHSEYALLANVIVAGESATFSDLPHFAGGIVPGDGVFTAWSYRAGPSRTEAFLLNPQPISARTAQEWGVVSEVVPAGGALGRAKELAKIYLKAPEVTRRNTRIHFIQPLKARIVAEVSNGLALEGLSATALVEVLSERK